METHSPLQPPTPTIHDNKLTWTGLYGASAALAIARLQQAQSRPLLLLTANAHQATLLQQEIEFYQPNLSIHLFPDWETLPYDHFSPHDDIISARLKTLYELPNLQSGVIISSAANSLQRILPISYLQQHMLIIEINQQLQLNTFAEQLTQAGYQRVEQVIQHGEFAIRGALIDLFPSGSDLPYRLELFDDNIESIRSFDPETQRSTEKINKIELLPAREFPLTESSISRFRQNWRARFSGNPMDSPTYQHISAGYTSPGVEYYLPLFFEHTAHLCDYLPNNTCIIHIGDTAQAITDYWQEIKERFEQLRFDVTRPLCQPPELYYDISEHQQKLNKFTQIKITNVEQANIAFDCAKLPDITIDSHTTHSLDKLKKFLANTTQRTLFCAESLGRQEILLELLQQIGTQPQIVKQFADFIDGNMQSAICHGAIYQGFISETANINLITENELFGHQIVKQRAKTHTKVDPDLLIKSLAELQIGAPVVHIDFGVGRYHGLTNIDNDGQQTEYLILEYADKDKVYVPVASLDKISRYSGANATHAPLQRLGNKQWQKIKEKTAQKAQDVAAHLLDIYSKRQLAKGFAFLPPNEDFEKFRRAFPFEETEDQTKAINAVISDMCSEHCMDRLVCGDVGFGKTEVAMQAAFLALQSGKQVAVLVPTTLLAQQHTRTFIDRFAEIPVKIAGLSRLRTPKEQQTVIEELALGKLDIVIGTHKLLNPDIKYKDLGLLIVDEEHRFGVKQKEKIKALRSNVDILTLTATPIPRTMNMVLAGTRDLSIIATPPARRLAIKTFVHEYQASIIREAILREARRGGQVYFLHNDVASIEATVEKLKQIAPESKFAFAHGQMRERQLENVMSDFYHQKFNVLVCTTIIESGIDIPSANTIIINKANHFGLAQLHQLRGRVGRSHHQAYAYLLTPAQAALTTDAKQRLEAISQLEDLGVGFQLATHDLEIRGAGELLGEEQSGHIEAVGFSLYSELLSEAVSALKSGRKPDFEHNDQQSTEINLPISTLIPETWIADVATRLDLYKRLSSCHRSDEINEFKIELIDRFGRLPQASEDLIKQAQLRLLAQQLGIQKIVANKQYGYLHFARQPNINPAKVIELIQTQHKDYQLQGQSKLRFTIKDLAPLPLFERLHSLLNVLK